MNYELTTITRFKNTFQKNTRFNFEDFLIACPFSLSYLKEKNRKQELMQWRQIGMAWYAAEFNSITNAGKIFGYDHSTVIHALKCVSERKYNPNLNHKVNKVLELMNMDIESPEEFNMREISSLVYLEKLIKKRLLLVEK
jgi:hypothetical protein